MDNMRLSDLSNGPDWIVWVIFVVFVILSVLLLSGRGSFLIAGYNTASKEEKEQYNKKKLCRITGGGLAVVALVLLAAELFEHVLPGWFVYVVGGVVVLDCVVMILAANRFCKK